MSYIVGCWTGLFYIALGFTATLGLIALGLTIWPKKVGGTATIRHRNTR